MPGNILKIIFNLNTAVDNFLVRVRSHLPGEFRQRHQGDLLVAQEGQLEPELVPLVGLHPDDSILLLTGQYIALGVNFVIINNADP